MSPARSRSLAQFITRCEYVRLGCSILNPGFVDHCWAEAGDPWAGGIIGVIHKGIRPSRYQYDRNMSFWTIKRSFEIPVDDVTGAEAIETVSNTG